MIRNTLLVLYLIFSVSCSRGGGTDAKPPAESSSPGTEKSKGDASSATSVKIEGEAQRLAGIAVAEIQPVSVPNYFTASEQIIMNEERTSHIGTYTDGRVTELHVNVGA